MSWLEFQEFNSQENQFRNNGILSDYGKDNNYEHWLPNVWTCEQLNCPLNPYKPLQPFQSNRSIVFVQNGKYTGNKQSVCVYGVQCTTLALVIHACEILHTSTIIHSSKSKDLHALMNEPFPSLTRNTEHTDAVYAYQVMHHYARAIKWIAISVEPGPYKPVHLCSAYICIRDFCCLYCSKRTSPGHWPFGIVSMLLLLCTISAESVVSQVNKNEKQNICSEYKIRAKQ